MEPRYFRENRYSFVVDAVRGPAIDYEVDTTETALERDVHQQLAAANRLLMEGRHSAALEGYRHVRAMVSAILNPAITVPNGGFIDWLRLDRVGLVDALVSRSAEVLVKTPVATSLLPAKLRATDVALPDSVVREFAPFTQIGVRDPDADIGGVIDAATTLTAEGNFAGALKLFQTAQQSATDPVLSAALLHDTAVLQERTGKRDAAISTFTESALKLEQARAPEVQALVLSALEGAQLRGGKPDEAGQTRVRVDEIVKTHSIFPILAEHTVDPAFGASLGSVLTRPGRLSAFGDGDRPGRFGVVGGRLGSLVPAQRHGHEGLILGDTPDAQADGVMEVRLLSAGQFTERKTPKQLTILDSQLQPLQIALDGNATQSLTRFYDQMVTTTDVGLLMGYLNHHTVTVAHLTHVYHWVIPMAVGDCLAALGSYAEAEAEYLSTLDYKYLNKAVESVNLWVRLAELYLDWGDRLYRQARNDIAAFADAKAKYELLLRLDNTLDDASPLYADPLFADMRARAGSAVQSLFVDDTASEENPRVQMALSRARLQLTKIDGQLNFIGVGVQVPPFGFEYLQNLARYVAQHASQVEQMYIQFQSTGENEQLREQQMAQQVEVAAASVDLERRGLDEARAGVDVASANLRQADVQAQNAVEAADDFDSVRWELLELDTLSAWANASAVDRDDQVKLTITGYNYYNADHKRRNVVLKEIAAQRTRISHDLEANRLEREIEAANSYRVVAQQQVRQAQARVAVAEQRIAIAAMQEQHARENLEFLQGREFTSAMWYNLARESRRIASRYLDMGVEVATMMEMAYTAETGRDLRKIKFEYGLNDLHGLLGAEALLLDIDFFSIDYVRTKSKKAQMRQTLSLADLYPMAFDRLLRTGRTYFETTLEHFDRRYPGFYLQKLKQVEVVFVGLNGSEGTHGTLRNIGLSRFRTKDGAIVDQTYPADVMPLSEYNVRQDAIVFQLDNKELRLFENNGVATMWQLDLPLGSNTFDLRQILDVQLVVYYDGFFDGGLEQQVMAALPRSGGSSRGLSLQLYAPDELYFLRAQGTARLSITPDMFPANHTGQRLRSYVVRATGTDVAGLKVRASVASSGASHTFTLDADGAADGGAFAAPVGGSLFDDWTFEVATADNPGFDLATLRDLSMFVEYDFDYRS
jgi:hypothetical protein